VDYNLVENIQVILALVITAMALINMGTLIWAWRLHNELRRRPTPKVYDVHLEGTKILTELDIADVQRQAQQALQQSTQDAINQMQGSIKHTTEQAAMHVNETAQNTINQEFEKYRVSLQALREQSITEFSKMQQELDQKRIVMQQALERVARAELARRVDQFGDRLGDVVSGYIVESLGSDVDLGAQMPFILRNLESHKDDIKRDVLDQ
jgi:hypothetical protein